MHEATKACWKVIDYHGWGPTDILATVTAIDDLGYKTALDKNAAAKYLNEHFSSVSTNGPDWINNNALTQTNCVWQPGGGPNNYEAHCALAHYRADPFNWYPNWWTTDRLEYILPDAKAPLNIIRLTECWQSILWND